jgi:signal transduction histidine kinase
LKPAPTTSLFLQALGLVLATLVAVLIAATVVILNLPPPPPEIYTVAEVAQAVHTGKTTYTQEGRALEVSEQAGPPVGETFGRRRLEFRSSLADALKIPQTDIVVTQSQTRLIALGAPPRGGRRPLSQLNVDQTILMGQFEVSVRQPDGHWLTVAPRRALIDPWQQRVLLVLAAAAAAVTPLAWWFARRLAAPIAAFARAAERLGRDPEAAPLEIRGSSEVGAAAAAFNEMQRRLKRYIDYRTSMMAAIAHDLRTPLTRLRFRIEAAPEDLRIKLAADIDEMDAMISSTLAFVKDATQHAQRTKLEVASLLETVMDEAAETGGDAAVEQADRAVVEGDPIALKRLVSNLVDNALKFGSRARGRAFTESGMAIIEIRDNGPGVPPDEVERAFEPFHRLENSRSRETGGIGLGLAVVRAIARAHGGEVNLINRPKGGLTARVSLPLSMRSGLQRPSTFAAPPTVSPVGADGAPALDHSFKAG